jgi:hypothetical protein
MSTVVAFTAAWRDQHAMMTSVPWTQAFTSTNTTTTASHSYARQLTQKLTISNLTQANITRDPDVLRNLLDASLCSLAIVSYKQPYLDHAHIILPIIDFPRQSSDHHLADICFEAARRVV